VGLELVRIAYAKLGRSILLDPAKWGVVGGDNEPLHLLLDLAERHPEHTWVVAGRHSGDPGNLPTNVEVPALPKGDDAEAQAVIEALYENVDRAVIHLGQHGTSNQPIPQDKDQSKLTNPQEWSRRYAGPILRGLNARQTEDLSFEPVWLCQDPRNYLKARDLMWYPRAPILGQYTFTREQTHWRFGDSRSPAEFHDRNYRSRDRGDGSWISEHSYMYSGLELAGVPPWERMEEHLVPFEDRGRFGVLMNENREYVKNNRLDIARQWVLPLEPEYWHGKWRDVAQQELGREITSVAYDQVPSVLASTKSTFTTPASGSKWATAKPWECFAVGTVCFFHPLYDAQGNIIPTVEDVQRDPEASPDLKAFVQWLRPATPEQLIANVNAVNESIELYDWLSSRQLQWLAHRRNQNMIHNYIDALLGISKETA
jgi:hypothetical protein